MQKLRGIHRTYIANNLLFAQLVIEPLFLLGKSGDQVAFLEKNEQDLGKTQRRPWKTPLLLADLIQPEPANKFAHNSETIPNYV